MTPRLTLEGRVPASETRPPRIPSDSRGAAAAGPRTAPGEFTVTAVLAAALGLSSIASGVASDNAPLVLAAATAFAVFAVGIVWPIVALRNVAIAATAPRDAMVGGVVPIEVSVSGSRTYVELRTLDPPTAWRTVVGDEHGIVLHAAARRGVLAGVRVEVRSGAPLGVLVRRKVFHVRLPAPVFIAPRPARIGWQPTIVSDEAMRDAAATVSMLGGDTVRSVRDYVAGDAARVVHWPTTARVGELVVREFEPAPRTGVAIVVDLTSAGTSADTGAVEAAASHAAGLARAVLGSGGACWLVTATDSGPVVAPVATVRDLNRRLAAAIAGPLPEPPVGWPVVVISGPARSASKGPARSASKGPARSASKGPAQ